MAVWGQRGAGELHLRVTDAAGLGVEAALELVSQANQVRLAAVADAGGDYVAKGLPFGFYKLRVERSGFVPVSRLIEIRSEVPLEYRVTLGVAPIETTVRIEDSETALDPQRTGTVYYLGSQTLRERRASQPGRAVLDLVESQPGWILEANGVLHPRGSEYNVQYVIDGFPIADNRSPAFAPAIEIEDLQAMNVFTGAYPAEYGRKLGGIIEVTTARDLRPGFHGKAVLNAGSFSTRNGYLSGQWARERTAATLSVEGVRTDRYLDPPVEENYSNRGSGSGFAAGFERDWSDRDRLRLSIRQSRTGFLVPNERLQQEAGQRQDRRNAEIMGQISYQRVLSPSLLAAVRGMVRDLSAELWSNPLSTPILADQQRGFREAYIGASLAAHWGAHEFKSGGEATLISMHERFSYRITDRRFFDPDVPRRFGFQDQRQGREKSWFVQDLVRAGRWTFSAGLRGDHYGLLVHETAVSPRLGVSWHWPSAGLVVRASYDRAFEVPAIENLLLASSAAAQRLAENGTGLPVPPSRGNFYQASLAKSLLGKLRLDATYFRRDVRNFGDDSLLLNTGVSFPITFASASIHGFESKVDLPRWGPISGFISYSNLVGTGRLPITGGLFLEENAQELLRSTDRFPITQEQRNTARARLRCQVTPRAWIASSAWYGSGLPIERDSDLGELEQRLGRRVLERVNLAHGRVRPSFSLDVSAGVDLWNRENRSARLQADILNLTDRLNAINFAGLFSGTALAPPRGFGLRLQIGF